MTENAEGVALAGGPGASAVLSWMRNVAPKGVRWQVEAVDAPRAGGPFGAVATLSDTSLNGLWPSVAMTPAGDAIAVWVANTDGSGAGKPTAAISTWAKGRPAGERGRRDGRRSA